MRPLDNWRPKGFLGPLIGSYVRSADEILLVEPLKNRFFSLKVVHDRSPLRAICRSLVFFTDIDHRISPSEDDLSSYEDDS